MKAVLLLVGVLHQLLVNTEMYNTRNVESKYSIAVQ